MTGTSSGAEHFHVQVSADPRPVDVLLSVDMNSGIVLTDKTTHQTHRVSLEEISKWSLRNGRLLLYTRSSSSRGEDDVVVLLGSTYTLRAVLDTLTSCCMQLAEILEHEEEELSRRERHQPAYVHPASSSITFWHNPEFTGWMQSQGEVIKTWRKRWFVLKDGYLFRFSGPDSVGPDATPRGVLDLSSVSSVSADGTRENGIRVETGSGTVSFLAENADEQIKWISALEEGVASVLRKVAGVDGERAQGSTSCIEKLEKGYVRMQQGQQPRQQSRQQPLQQYEQHQQHINTTGRVMPSSTSMVDRFRQPASMVERKEQAYGLESAGTGGISQNTVSVAPQERLPELIQIANINYDLVAGARQVQLPSSMLAAAAPSPVPSTAPDLMNLMDEPSAPAVQSPPQQNEGVWQTYHTEDGRAYYHNAITGETQWA